MSKEGFRTLFLRLYRTDNSFRGFLDFAFFGGVTLLFLSPPALPDWRSFMPNSGPSNSSSSPGPATAPQTPASRPAVANVAPAPKREPHPIDDGNRALKAFLHLSPAEDRPALEKIADLIVARQFDAALSQLETRDPQDPNVPFLRGVALVRKDGKGSAASAGEYQKAADLGHPEAMYYLSSQYTQGIGVPVDKMRAVALRETAYQAGSQTAGYFLAVTYAQGDLGFRNDEKARAIFEKLAASGHPRSLNWMGVFYRTGRGGLTRDDAKANQFYREAAALGEVTAMRNLHGMYRGGNGVQKDLKEALMWLQRAVDENNPEALRIMGKFLAFGEEGTTPDPVRGASLLRQAALKNDGPAQELLGQLYEEGKGLPRDPVQAYVFYGLANHHGVGSARMKLTALESAMAPSEKERAQRLLAAALPARSGSRP